MSSDKKLVAEWIEGQRSQNTRRAYGFHIAKFQAWYHPKTLKDFLRLKPHERTKIAVKFQNELMEKEGYKANAVSAMVTALASFSRAQGEILDMRRKRLPLEMDTTSHAFSTRDLTAMFDVGSLEEKALVATFASLAWEASAVLGLDKKHVQQLLLRARDQKDNFVFFPDQRQKTHAERLGVLNPIALETLEKWFATPEAQKFETLFHFGSVDGLNKAIQRLTRKANIKTVGRIHSHLFRKWAISKMSSAGFSDSQWKLVSGKKISSSDRTYLQTLPEEIEKKYRASYEEYFNIKPARVVQVLDEAKAKEIDDLKETIQKLQERVTGLGKGQLHFARMLEAAQETEGKYGKFILSNCQKCRNRVLDRNRVDEEGLAVAWCESLNTGITWRESNPIFKKLVYKGKCPHFKHGESQELKVL